MSFVVGVAAQRQVSQAAGMSLNADVISRTSLKGNDGRSIGLRRPLCLVVGIVYAYSLALPLRTASRARRAPTGSCRTTQRTPLATGATTRRAARASPERNEGRPPRR